MEDYDQPYVPRFDSFSKEDWDRYNALRSHPLYWQRKSSIQSADFTETDARAAIKGKNPCCCHCGSDKTKKKHNTKDEHGNRIIQFYACRNCGRTFGAQLTQRGKLKGVTKPICEDCDRAMRRTGGYQKDKDFKDVYFACDTCGNKKKLVVRSRM